MRRSLLAVLGLLTLAGCAAYPAYWQHWARPGGTNLDFAASRDVCESMAYKRFPPMTTDGPGYYESDDQWCQPTAGGTNCLVINPGYLPQVGGSGDLNEGSRDAALQSCLIAGGWRPVATPEEGDAITRSAPEESPLPAGAVSKAATYCETIFYRKRNVALMALYGNRFNQCVTTRARGSDGS